MRIGIRILLLIAAAMSSYAQTHFLFTSNTGNDMTIVVPVNIDPTLDGDLLESGDEIGVFTSGGLCVGASIWNGSSNIAISVHGDNDRTTVVDGIAGGGQLTFRVWDASLSKEGDATIAFVSGGPNYSSDGMAILSSITAVTSSSSSYTVTYDGNGNSSGLQPSNTVSFLQGATVTVWDNSGSFAKTGYTFSGWNTAANGSGTAYATSATFTMGTANVVLYAKWVFIPTYTVTYDGNGNTSGTVPPDANNYLQGSAVTVLGNTGVLLRAGYTFSGWNTAANGSGTAYATGATFTMGTANVVLYAKWVFIPTYTVTYDGNGNTSGTVPLDANNYLQGSVVTILGNTGGLLRSGYTFAGWSTAANGTGLTYVAGGGMFVMAAANVVLYAKWVLIPTYTVTYIGNGNTSGTAPTDANHYEQSSVVIVLENSGGLTRSGYTFAGWNTSSNGNGTNYSASMVFTISNANVNLYAQWTMNTYTVTYNDNGSTGGTPPTDANTYLQGSTVIALSNAGALTKAGYTFAGWNTAADGVGTSYNVGVTFTMVNSNVVLYAQWTLNSTYTVTYNGNGNSSGTVPTDANNYEQGASVTVLGNAGAVLNTGYTFAGWNTATNGSGISYNSGATFTMGTADVIFYAQWTLNPTYTVTYNGNGNMGGGVPTDANNYQQNTTATVLGNTGGLTKTGYTFTGWNAAANGSGTNYSAEGMFTMGTANVVLYAQWTLITYTLTINQNIDQNPSDKIKDTIVAYGDTVRLNAPVVTGCSLVNWRITSGTALLLDSTLSTCRVILQKENVEITAHYSYSTSVLTTARKVPIAFGMSYNGRRGILSYTIPEIPGFSSVPVRIQLLDIQGQNLGCLLNENMRPGYYAVNIGIQRKTASGIVIGRMESLGHMSTVKIGTVFKH